MKKKNVCSIHKKGYRNVVNGDTCTQDISLKLKASLQISTVDITNWLMVTKYPFLTRQWVYFFFK